tara:strand:- start:586 stop:798 length:213 start_codon:yes stop_codon:yes gene_type:complete
MESALVIYLPSEKRKVKVLKAWIFGYFVGIAIGVLMVYQNTHWVEARTFFGIPIPCFPWFFDFMLGPPIC